MGLEICGEIQDNIIHHRYYNTLTCEDVERGIEAFFQANIDTKQHILIDLRDVHSHTLSMVNVYHFAKQVNCRETGQIYVIGSANLVVRTLISLSSKIVEQIAPLPCYFITDSAELCELEPA